MKPCSRYKHGIFVAAFDVLDDLTQHAIFSLKGLDSLPQLGELCILVTDFFLNGANIRLLAFTRLLS